MCATLLSLGLAACAHDATTPRADTLQLRFDLRALTGSASLGDAASVLARITLSIGLPNQDGSIFSADFNVAPTDSIVETTVDLEPGPYSFIVNAFSNNGTTIYFLSTIAFMDGVSPVVLTPQATNAVLVVGPVDAGLDDRLTIRNAGNQSLTWVANCTSAQSGNCANARASALRGTLAPGGSTTILVCAGLNTSDTFNLTFGSGVGTVTVRKAARPLIPGNQLLC